MSIMAMARADHKTQYHKVRIHNRSVFTTITTSAAVANQWIVDMKKKCSNPAFRLMVGLDIDVVGGENPRVATIQFSLSMHCLIYRMGSEPLPPPLRDFLLDNANNVFVGVDLTHKFGLLRQETGIEVVATDMRNFEGREHSLTELAAVAVPRLGFVRSVAARDWSAPVPSYEDVEYACIGAYVSQQIGDILVVPTPRKNN